MPLIDVKCSRKGCRYKDELLIRSVEKFDEGKLDKDQQNCPRCGSVLGRPTVHQNTNPKKRLSNLPNVLKV